MSYITLQTTPQQTIQTYLTNDWGNNDYPIIVNVSGVELIPKNLMIQQLLVPTGVYITDTDIIAMFKDYGVINSNPYIKDSGCYYTVFKSNSDSDVLKSKFDIKKSGENTAYNYWYGFNYAGLINFEEVYNITVVQSSGIITYASQPNINAIQIIASGYPVDIDNTRLSFNISHNDPLVNSTILSSNYEVFIEDGTNYYNLSGVIITSGTITTQSGNINIDLPFTKEVQGTNTEVNYTIGMRYTNQEGITTKYLKYKTNEISKSNNEFNTGKVKIGRKKPKYIGNYLIDKDISTGNDGKYRLSIDVEDISLISNTYYESAKYSSRIYNLDIPLYSISLVTKEIIPPGIDPTSIEYYIEFSDKQHRINPINKPMQYRRTSTTTGTIQNATFGLVAGQFQNTSEVESNIIPKILVLDNISSTSSKSEVKSINSDLPIYSFRVVIIFNIKTNNGQTLTEYYIPPSIDFYECHITDRQSYLKV